MRTALLAVHVAPTNDPPFRVGGSACWPLGLEPLAAPMLRAGYALPTGPAALNATLGPANVLYRFMDGSWTDNTNAAFILARMQVVYPRPRCRSCPQPLDLRTAGSLLRFSIYS